MQAPLWRNMEHSEQITELAAALAKAQGEIENASKNAANPHFKSKYADLAEVISVIREPMAKHGLSVIQSPSFDGEMVTVTTMVLHTSGQWLKGTLSMPVARKDAQGIGSAITYSRRYSLAATFRVSQEDDDGNAAVEGAKGQANGKTYVLKKEPETPPEPKANPEMHVIEGAVKAKGKSLAEVSPNDLQAAIENPVVAKRLTAADKVNIQAVLAKYEKMRADAAPQGTSLEEDEIPSTY